MSSRDEPIIGRKREDYMRRFLVGLIAQGLTKPEIRPLAVLYSDTLFKPAWSKTNIKTAVAAVWKHSKKKDYSTPWTT